MTFPTFLYNSMLNSTRVLTKDKLDITISSTSFISQIWLYSRQLNFVFVCFFCIPNLITILFVFGLSFLSNKLRHITRDLGFTPPSSYSEKVYHFLVQLSLFNFIHSWFSLQNKCKRHGQFSVTRKQNHFFQLCYKGNSAREFVVYNVI